VLPMFTTRNVDDHTTCVPHQNSGSILLCDSNRLPRLRAPRAAPPARPGPRSDLGACLTNDAPTAAAYFAARGTLRLSRTNRSLVISIVACLPSHPRLCVVRGTASANRSRSAELTRLMAGLS